MSGTDRAAGETRKRAKEFPVRLGRWCGGGHLGGRGRRSGGKGRRSGRKGDGGGAVVAAARRLRYA
jgi:hypothetical protein